MRRFASFAVLLLVAAPVFADGFFELPEPESLALFAIGGVAMLAARRKSR